MRKLFTVLLAIGAVLFALNYFGDDESDTEDESYASDRNPGARQIYTVIVAGTCGGSGCSAKRTTCKVDVSTGVFSQAMAHNAEAILYQGNLGKSPSGECSVGSVIVGVEREGDLRSFGLIH